MSKARIKVTVRSRNAGKNGALLTRVPMQVVANDNPTGERLYQTKAQASIRIKRTRGGKPRVR